MSAVYDRLVHAIEELRALGKVEILRMIMCIETAEYLRDNTSIDIEFTASGKYPVACCGVPIVLRVQKKPKFIVLEYIDSVMIRTTKVKV